MEYRWIGDISEFRNISAEWDKLLASSESRNPFLLSDFILTWWEHFKETSKLKILAIFDEGKLIGGIPLHLKNGSGIYGFARILSYVGGAAANYTEPLVGSTRAGILAMIEKALSDRRDWDLLYLSDVRGESPLVGEVKALTGKNPYRMRLIQDHMNLAVNLSCGQQSFFETVSWKLKKDLRAKRKHVLKEFGAISLREISGEEEVMKYFDTYTQFALQAFNKRSRKSSLEDRRYTFFLKDLMVVMDKSRKLSAYALLAGGRIMAISFGYKSDDGFDWVLTGFDYELKYYRPGYIMMEELIKNICDRGGTYCNLYGHDRFYKNQWANEETPLYKLFIIKRTVRGFCYSVLQSLESMMRSNSALVKFARRLKRS